MKEGGIVLAVRSIRTHSLAIDDFESPKNRRTIQYVAMVDYTENNSFLEVQLRMLRANDKNFRSLSLNLDRMEKDFSQQLAHWRESLFSFQVKWWSEIICSNETVETVAIDLSVSETTIWKKDQLRLLFDAIASLPRLRKIVIRQNNLGRPRRLNSIEAIIGAIRNFYSTIEGFELWGNQIVSGVEHSLQKLLWTLQSCHKLTSLKFMGFDLDPLHVAMIVPLMAMPSLTEFGLGNSSSGFLPVADALTTNTNIENLTLSFVDRIEDPCCLALARALQCNAKLQVLSLLNASPRNNVSGISSKSQGDFLQMMEQNMTLRDFITRGQVGEKMLLYLKLNKAGRRQLFEQFGVTRELWVDKVTLSKEDVDCTFYFLTMNPSICVT